jgi:hypothetical protein
VASWADCAQDAFFRSKLSRGAAAELPLCGAVGKSATETGLQHPMK